MGHEARKYTVKIKIWCKISKGQSKESNLRNLKVDMMVLFYNVFLQHIFEHSTLGFSKMYIGSEFMPDALPDRQSQFVQPKTFQGKNKI